MKKNIEQQYICLVPRWTQDKPYRWKRHLYDKSCVCSRCGMTRKEQIERSKE